MVIRNSKIIFGALCLTWLLSCKKWDDYKKYQTGGELVYPGIITNPLTYPGAGRVMLTWDPSIDPSVKKYIVSWNNGADSLVVNANSHSPVDTIRITIEGLTELNYFFSVYSIDDKGNRSVAANIPGVKIYGPIYQGGLFNRGYKTYDYSGGTLRLVWNVPDTINIRTEVDYVDTTGTARTAWLFPEQDTLVIPDWKDSTILYYRSSYIPVRSAIDTFTVGHYDSLELKL